MQLQGWSSPGTTSPKERWALDIHNGWSPPGQDTPASGTQYVFPDSFDGSARAPGWHAMVTPAGQAAPTHLTNYTPATGEVHGPGELAPIEHMNFSLVPTDSGSGESKDDGWGNAVGTGQTNFFDDPLYPNPTPQATPTPTPTPGLPPGPGVPAAGTTTPTPAPYPANAPIQGPPVPTATPAAASSGEPGSSIAGPVVKEGNTVDGLRVVGPPAAEGGPPTETNTLWVPGAGFVRIDPPATNVQTHTVGTTLIFIDPKTKIVTDMAGNVVTPERYAAMVKAAETEKPHNIQTIMVSMGQGRSMMLQVDPTLPPGQNIFNPLTGQRIGTGAILATGVRPTDLDQAVRSAGAAGPSGASGATPPSAAPGAASSPSIAPPVDRDSYEGTGLGRTFSPYDTVFRRYAGSEAKNDELISIIAATTKAESGWNPKNPGDGGSAHGIFQMNTAGGAGTGIDRSKLEDVDYAASVMVPQFVAAYRKLKAAGLKGQELAVETAMAVERPSAPTARGNYARAYNEVTNSTEKIPQIVPPAGGGGKPGSAGAGGVSIDPSTGLPIFGSSGDVDQKGRYSTFNDPATGTVYTIDTTDGTVKRVVAGQKDPTQQTISAGQSIVAKGPDGKWGAVYTAPQGKIVQQVGDYVFQIDPNTGESNPIAKVPGTVKEVGGHFVIPPGETYSIERMDPKGKTYWETYSGAPDPYAAQLQQSRDRASAASVAPVASVPTSPSANAVGVPGGTPPAVPSATPVAPPAAPPPPTGPDPSMGPPAPQEESPISWSLPQNTMPTRPQNVSWMTPGLDDNSQDWASGDTGIVGMGQSLGGWNDGVDETSPVDMGLGTQPNKPPKTSLGWNNPVGVGSADDEEWQSVRPPDFGNEDALNRMYQGADYDPKNANAIYVRSPESPTQDPNVRPGGMTGMAYTYPYAGSTTPSFGNVHEPNEYGADVWNNEPHGGSQNPYTYAKAWDDPDQTMVSGRSNDIAHTTPSFIRNRPGYEDPRRPIPEGRGMKDLFNTTPVWVDQDERSKYENPPGRISSNPAEFEQRLSWGNQFAKHQANTNNNVGTPDIYGPDSGIMSTPQSSQGGGVTATPQGSWMPPQTGTSQVPWGPGVTVTPRMPWEPGVTMTPQSPGGGGVMSNIDWTNDPFSKRDPWRIKEGISEDPQGGARIPMGSEDTPSLGRAWGNINGGWGDEATKEYNKGILTTNTRPFPTMDDGDDVRMRERTGTGQAGPGGIDPNGWTPPVDPSQIVGMGNKFGDQVSMEGIHKGTDLQAYEGTPTVAPVAGTVIEVTNDPQGLGIQVAIQSASDGEIHRLSHLQKADVQPGDVVELGQPVGTVGATGAGATGPHLDYREQTPDGQYVNPEQRLGPIAQMPMSPDTVGEGQDTDNGWGDPMWGATAETAGTPQGEAVYQHVTSTPEEREASDRSFSANMAWRNLEQEDRNRTRQTDPLWTAKDHWYAGTGNEAPPMSANPQAAQLHNAGLLPPPPGTRFNSITMQYEPDVVGGGQAVGRGEDEWQPPTDSSWQDPGSTDFAGGGTNTTGSSGGYTPEQSGYSGGGGTSGGNDTSGVSGAVSAALDPSGNNVSMWTGPDNARVPTPANPAYAAWAASQGGNGTPVNGQPAPGTNTGSLPLSNPEQIKINQDTQAAQAKYWEGVVAQQKAANENQKRQIENQLQIENEKNRIAMMQARTAQDAQAETERHNRATEALTLQLKQLDMENAELDRQMKLRIEGSFGEKTAVSLMQTALKNPWLERLTGMAPAYGTPGGPQSNSGLTGQGALAQVLQGWSPTGGTTSSGGGTTNTPQGSPPPAQTPQSTTPPAFLTDISQLVQHPSVFRDYTGMDISQIPAFDLQLMQNGGWQQHPSIARDVQGMLQRAQETWRAQNPTPQPQQQAAAMTDTSSVSQDTGATSNAGWGGYAPITNQVPLPTWPQWQNMTPFERASYRTLQEGSQPWEQAQDQMRQAWAAQGQTTAPKTTWMEAAQNNPLNLEGRTQMAETFGETQPQYWDRMKRLWAAANATNVMQRAY